MANSTEASNPHQPGPSGDPAAKLANALRGGMISEMLVPRPGPHMDAAQKPQLPEGQTSRMRRVLWRPIRRCLLELQRAIGIRKVAAQGQEIARRLDSIEAGIERRLGSVTTIIEEAYLQRQQELDDLHSVVSELRLELVRLGRIVESSVARDNHQQSTGEH